jgi:predicted TIM-barrel fold metal-dependent hydrolase
MASSGSYTEIKKHVDAVRLVDTHEHLPQEPERIKQTVDPLATFFPHYASSDLQSAGMGEEDLLRLWDTSIPLEERWTIIEPWWEKISNTGYARALDIAIRGLYGVDGLTADTVKPLTQRMRERNKPGLYRWVLKERSGVDISILDFAEYDVDTEFFAPVLRIDELVMARDRTEIEALESLFDVSIHDFRDYVALIRRRFDDLKGKVVGIKIALAYRRPIFFDKRAFSEAEEAFNEIYRVRKFKRVPMDPEGESQKLVPESPGVEELIPMQDYLVHVAVQEAMRHGLPIQIHTGLHEGNENMLPNSNPELLVNLFMEYRDARFDVFHGSWPYCGELGALAKNFPNVYVDMCWMHIISPSRARSALGDWLDEVPANKILGFGGDYLFVEGVYGHSVIARDNVARVLAQKVDEGDYKLDDAKKYASWMLRENAMRLFFS